jgi:hypothetical protein
MSPSALFCDYLAYAAKAPDAIIREQNYAHEDNAAVTFLTALELAKEGLH